MGTSNRGFGAMDDNTQRDISRKGGQASQGGTPSGSQTTNPGNFANDKTKASRAGKKGGETTGGNPTT